MNLPRLPPDDRDRGYLKRWTFDQLDQAERKALDQIDPELETMRASDPHYRAQTEKAAGRRLQRGTVVRLAEQIRYALQPRHKSKADLPRLKAELQRRTANDLELSQLAQQVLTHKPKQGREKGDSRPKDRTQEEWEHLRDIQRTAKQIERIWKRELDVQRAKEFSISEHAIKLAIQYLYRGLGVKRTVRDDVLNDVLNYRKASTPKRGPK
jgi:hypothetical protein